MRAGAPKQVLDYVLDVMKNIISESRLKVILKETGFN
jgi:DNA-binding protein